MTKEEAKAMIKEVDANGKYKMFIAVIDRLPLQFYLAMSMWHQSRLIYSQTCIKRSPLGQRKNGLIRQVIFYDRTRKMWTFNAGDCLIEVTAWAGLTVLTFQCHLHMNLWHKPRLRCLLYNVTWKWACGKPRLIDLLYNSTLKSACGKKPWLIDFLYNVTLKWICGIERDWKTFLTLPLWHEHVAQTEIESLTLQCHLEMNLLYKARLKDFPYNATLKWTYGIRRGWCTYFKMPSWHEHDGSRMDMEKMLLDRNHHIISCLKRVCI